MPCTLRGRFKLDYRLKKDKLTTSDVAVVGDYVEYTDSNDGSGLITAIDNRINFLSRKSPKIKGTGKHGERKEQILAANIDCFFVVVSVDSPEFNHKTLDRFLIAGESAQLHTSIIINKSDLIADDEFYYWVDLYKSLGYPVYLTSRKDKKTTKKILEQFAGKTSLFWGPSGVGKSTLLNTIFPHLDIRTDEISDATNKGKHTTTGVYMYVIGNNTFVIDTPGVREIDPYGLVKEDLAHYFPDFREYLNQCKYNRCTHEHEPGCAIINAVEEEALSVERYESYLRILDTIEDKIEY